MLRKKLALLVLACASFGMHAMEEVTDKALVRQELGKLTILHDQKGFAVSDELRSQRVQNCFIDKELRGLSNDKLAKYLTAGNYVRLSQMHDGQYALRASGRLNGSGPTFGVFMYGATKTFLYGLIGGAAVATTVAAAPVVAPAVAAAAAGLPAVGIAGLPIAAASGTAVGLSATATAATATATLGIGSVGGAAAIVGVVESISLAVGALCGMAPTP